MNNNFSKLDDLELETVVGGVGYGEVTASGSFASNTGTALNLFVSWSARTDAFGNKTLDVTVSSSSYSLYCSGAYNGVELNVNGMTYVASSPAINYSGNTVTTNRLASFSIPNAIGPANITAVWHFNGSYSGVPIADVRATGTAMF